MSDWLDRIVEAARRDKNLAKKLREIADIDSKVMPTGVLTSTKQMSESEAIPQMMQRSSNLCDEVARAIADPDEDPDEIALWISYNCQKIVKWL